MDPPFSIDTPNVRVAQYSFYRLGTTRNKITMEDTVLTKLALAAVFIPAIIATAVWNAVVPVPPANKRGRLSNPHPDD